MTTYPTSDYSHGELLDAEYYESLARALPDLAEEDRRALQAAGQVWSGVDALRRLTAVAQALVQKYTGSVEGV